MDSHHRNRKSSRLKDYDYRQEGAYFVTICTHQQKRFFGFIENEMCNLSPLGKIAHDDWARMPTYYDHIALDAYVIMPNHMHGIIIITKSGQTSLGCVDIRELFVSGRAEARPYRHKMMIGRVGTAYMPSKITRKTPFFLNVNTP